MIDILADQCLSHSVPDEDDLEVSVFGPGFGECLAVHMPGGKWILVDSCRDSRRRPASLAYLEEMGIAAESDVAMVVASHWHFDHVDGIAEMVAECRSAEPVMSLALHTRELLAFAHAAQYLGSGTVPRPIAESQQLTETIDTAQPARYITLSQARMKLLESRYGTLTTSVDSLSPSPASVSVAMSDLSQSRLEAGKELEAPQPDQNAAAVVLRVRSGNVSMLLASDLEIQADPARGWRGVMDAWGDDGHQSQVIKIAHHGSANGDSEIIWSDPPDRDAHRHSHAFPQRLGASPARQPGRADCRALLRPVLDQRVFVGADGTVCRVRRRASRPGQAALAEAYGPGPCQSPHQAGTGIQLGG